LKVVSEHQDTPEGAVAARDRGPEAQPPAAEPEAPVTPEAPAPEAPAAEDAPTADAPPAPGSEEPVATEPGPGVEEVPVPEQPAPAAEQPAPAAEEPAPAAEQPAPAAEEPAPAAAEEPAAEESAPVGPKIIGVAEEKALPVVKARLQEKPKREPLPWPELRAAVAAVKDDLEVAELKELFRLFPAKVRDEVTENVRGFRKGARRPVSQHAAKQLARAVHTARRMKKGAQPSGDVAEALGQAMAAELIASLEPEKAAQVILPRRDLLEREARQAQRRQRDEDDRRRDEQRRRRREDARGSRQQTSFGSYSGAKIQGLDEIAALFREEEPEPQPEPEAQAAPPEAPAAEPAAPERSDGDDEPGAS
jgi:hypothetical protein